MKAGRKISESAPRDMTCVLESHQSCCLNVGQSRKQAKHLGAIKELFDWADQYVACTTRDNFGSDDACSACESPGFTLRGKRDVARL